MKRNFNLVFKELDGTPLMYKEGTPFTLRLAAINALQLPCASETVDGAEQIRRYDLAVNIYSATEDVEVSSEDIVLLKSLINRTYKSPLVVAPAWRALEATLSRDV